MEGDGDTVYCELKYSGVGVGLLLGAAACTLALVLTLPLPMPWMILVMGWVCAAACLACRGLCAFAALRLDPSGALVLVACDGRWRAGRVRGGCFVAPWLTIVRWRPEGGWMDRCLVLLPDASDAESLRKIRVLLKWA